MLSSICGFIRPAWPLLVRFALSRIAAEARDGKLPSEIAAESQLVFELCNVLLVAVGGTAVPPKPAPEAQPAPPAAVPEQPAAAPVAAG